MPATPMRTSAGANTDLALQVVSAEVIAEGVRRLVLRKPDGARLPDWAPGAHIDLFLPGDRIRQYSLCGDRWDAHTYQVAVLREPDGRGGSAYVHDHLKVGDVVGVGGPRNNFAMAPAEHYLFIAGGIGITPILPMIHQAQMVDASWTLLYGGRTAASMAFVDELSRYGRQVRIRPQDTHGLLPIRESIKALPADGKVYCCGPAPLLAAVQAVGGDRKPGTVRIERFVAEPLASPVRCTPFEVELRRSGVTVTVQPHQSILDVVSEAGVPVLSSCGRGLCGTCESTVVDGVPDHRDSLLTNDERSSNTVMLPCVSRACSDRLVLDL
ncbi:PDR/VanB family oxidoreductase [Mycolicibacterium austroafricanum]|uniref:PDR/VanB family oxidoreductase n=1 Tax=Mycolicibacterium austroafricanum TaxID=39687 RepID=UPI000569910E|nr:PDR/VanB family oxidoreductase [Mycolicibacterium austroafricanum]QZY48910.1 PDR/VanB family oxidoreductase [Mycolicibacterium austroafricanum]